MQEAALRGVLERPHAHVLMSLRTLASSLGMDPSTLLRAIRTMGFDRYRSFQEHLRDRAVVQATPFALMEGGRRAGPRTIDGYLDEARQAALGNLQALRIEPDLLVRIAEQCHAARRIVVIGGDQAASLAHFLVYNLNMLGLPATAAVTPGEVVHLTRAASRRDVVIGITFARGLRQTIEGLRQARQRHAYCVALTDSLLSPAASVAGVCLIAATGSPSFAGSYAAPMAALDMLLVACAHARRAKSVAHLRAAESEQRTGFRWYRDE